MKTRERILALLVSIYIGLGPVVWFAGYSIGIIKRILLIAIILFFFKDLFGRRIKGLFSIVIAFVFLGISLYVNFTPDKEYSSLIMGILENILFFMIGYRFIQKGYLSKRLITIMISLLSFFCFFTITNSIIGIPDWYTPFFKIVEEEKQLSFEYDKLWSTGFSWSRAGWGASLCLYIPMCFLLFRDVRRRRIVLFLFLLIFSSLFICGCRSGLLGAVITSLLYIHYLSKRGELHIPKYIIVFGFLIIVSFIIFDSGYFSEHLRISKDDEATVARLLQYERIPDMLAIMGFWGVGDGVTLDILSSLTGRTHALHNTYARSLIEYGWLYGISIIVLSASILVKYFKSLSNDNTDLVLYGSVLINGLVAAMFEPALVFGYLGGYCLWWFSYGVFSFIIFNRNNIK